MKTMKYLMLLCAICTLSILNIDEVQAKKRPVQNIYMFGFSASFSDSTVYFTDIQVLDSAWVDEKTGFLEHRNLYSQQLKDYLAASMQANRVCVVMYALTKKEAEKKYLKMKRIYSKNADAPYDIRYLNENEFRFTRVQHYDEE